MLDGKNKITGLKGKSAADTRSREPKAAITGLKAKSAGIHHPMDKKPKLKAKGTKD